MDNLYRRYDPKQPLIDELEENSKDLKNKSEELFKLLKEVINVEESQNKIFNSINDIDALITYISNTADETITKRIKKVIKDRGL